MKSALLLLVGLVALINGLLVIPIHRKPPPIPDINKFFGLLHFLAEDDFGHDLREPHFDKETQHRIWNLTQALVKKEATQRPKELQNFQKEFAQLAATVRLQGILNTGPLAKISKSIINAIDPSWVQENVLNQQHFPYDFMYWRFIGAIVKYAKSVLVTGYFLEGAVEHAFRFGQHFAADRASQAVNASRTVRDLERVLNKLQHKTHSMLNSHDVLDLTKKWQSFLKTAHPFAFIEFERAFAGSDLHDFYLTDKTERSAALDSFQLPKPFKWDQKIFEQLEESKYLLKINALSHLPLAFYHGYTGQQLPAKFSHNVAEKYWNSCVHEYLRSTLLLYKVLAGLVEKNPYFPPATFHPPPHVLPGK